MLYDMVSDKTTESNRSHNSVLDQFHAITKETEKILHKKINAKSGTKIKVIVHKKALPVIFTLCATLCNFACVCLYSCLFFWVIFNRLNRTMKAMCITGGSARARNVTTRTECQQKLRLYAFISLHATL